jgi:hypothetical protein
VKAKFSTDPAIVVPTDDVLDGIVKSFIQNWLAPALAKELAEPETERKGEGTAVPV